MQPSGAPIASWQAEARALAAEGIDLGPPVGDPLAGNTAAGLLTVFENGLILQRPSGESFVLWGVLADLWRALCRPGVLYLPVQNPVRLHDGLACRLALADSPQCRVLLSHHAQLGTFLVSSRTLELWESQHGLGLPASPEQVIAIGGSQASEQLFRDPTRASETVIFCWRAGAFAIRGALLEKWRSSRASDAWWPLGDIVTTNRGSLMLQHFINPRTGALSSLGAADGGATFCVTGVIRDKWCQLGAEAGPLGIPLADEQMCSRRHGRKQVFGHSAAKPPAGCIVSVPGEGAFDLLGPVYSLWDELGAEGTVGFPETGTMTSGDNRGWYNQFLGNVRSRIYRTPAGSVLRICDPILATWVDTAAEAGPLGYPVAAEENSPAPECRSMQFDGGRITVWPDGRVRTSFADAASPLLEALPESVGTNWTFEPFAKQPHDLFFIASKTGRLFGRKRPVLIGTSGAETLRKCCLVDESMILGWAGHEQLTDSGVAVFYQPIDAPSRQEVFQQMAADPEAELYFPYPDLAAEDRRERCTPREFWVVTPERVAELNLDEHPIRDYILRMLSQFHLVGKVVFDPACSTGEFLAAIQSRYPGVYTIGQDASPQMIEYCRGRLDEVHCSDSVQPAIPEESADIVVFRFLNFHVVKTVDAHRLFLVNAKRCRKGGYLFVVGHTPVLVNAAWFEMIGLRVLQKTAYSGPHQASFQFYWLQREGELRDLDFESPPPDAAARG